LHFYIDFKRSTVWLANLVSVCCISLRINGWPEADGALVQVSTEAHAVALSAQMSSWKLHLLTWNEKIEVIQMNCNKSRFLYWK
jgi:hypothetical protein